MRFLTLWMLLCLGGCATSPVFTSGVARSPGDLRCEQQTSEIFAISGEIDDVMTACVRSELRPTTRTLILNSEGGSIDAALDIAELFEGRRLAMQIEGQCNSSCANYLLPLAGRITLMPGAIILLHGGVDPWTIDNFRRRRAEFLKMEAKAGRSEAVAAEAFDELIAISEELRVRQADFARRNGIPPGWLLYREPGFSRVQGMADQPRRGRAVLVEEPMLRSCLSAAITPYQEELSREVLRSPKRLSLLWARIVPSGDARCTPAD